MIQVYCVQLIGEPILLDGEEFGFYRNEYVAAFSEDRAVDVAKTKTLKRLYDKGFRFIEGKPFSLKVESIKPNMPPWRMFRNEGFSLFLANESDSF